MVLPDSYLAGMTLGQVGSMGVRIPCFQTCKLRLRSLCPKRIESSTDNGLSVLGISPRFFYESCTWLVERE